MNSNLYILPMYTI